jgi:hypothetical protein
MVKVGEITSFFPTTLYFLINFYFYFLLPSLAPLCSWGKGNSKGIFIFVVFYCPRLRNRPSALLPLGHRKKQGLFVVCFNNKIPPSATCSYFYYLLPVPSALPSHPLPKGLRGG